MPLNYSALIGYGKDMACSVWIQALHSRLDAGMEICNGKLKAPAKIMEVDVLRMVLT